MEIGNIYRTQCNRSEMDLQDKTNRNAKDEIEKHKVKLVTKGYKQQYEVNYEDFFALVARMKTMRLMISSAA